jgi:formylglycine-generating enzyme required for sulfatase activity
MTHRTTLLESLERGDLALFIGADLPREVTGLPCRADLARELAERKGIDATLSLAQVAQHVARGGNRWEFTAFLRDQLDTTDVSPQPFHQYVVNLVLTHQVNHIITTAYDNLLELAFQEAGIPINRVVRGSDVSFIAPDRPTLIKLYGDAQQPDTLIVTEDDHYGLGRDRDKEDLLHEVRTVLRRQTVLFLGYNLADPDFNLLWREVLDRAGRFARTAYAVWPDLPEGEVQMWRDRGIVILEEEPWKLMEEIKSPKAANQARDLAERVADDPAQMPAAREAMQRWQAMAPDDADAQSLAAQLDDQLQQATSLARDLAERVDEDPGQMPAAREAVQRWLVMAPDDADAQSLATRLDEHVQQAAAQAHELAERVVDDPAQMPAAREAVQRWLALVPDDADTKALVGRLNEYVQQAAAQACDLAESVADDPTQMPAAREAVQRWLVMAPDDADAQSLAARLDALVQQAAAQSCDLAECVTDNPAQMLAAREADDTVKIVQGLLMLLEQLRQAREEEQGEAARKAEAERRAKEEAAQKKIDKQRAAVVQMPQIMKKRQPFEPEMILIPAGEFLMGSNRQDAAQPQHTLYLPDYYIAKAPVTNAQWRTFVEATGHVVPKHWQKRENYGLLGMRTRIVGVAFPEDKAQHPVAHVSWDDAVAYCAWLAEVTGKPYQLPSEAEWEKAARGTDGRLFPWGNNPFFLKGKCNTKEARIGATTPVGAYSPKGDSVYGCVDMTGNVWEWTRSRWRTDFREPGFKYPYQADDGREDMQASGMRVWRGGSFANKAANSHPAFRFYSLPLVPRDIIGFRVGVLVL